MTPAPDSADPSVPELIVLDVNETLSDLSPLADAFEAVGLESSGVEAWFAGVLRDGFALTVLGDCPSFAEIASASLRVRLHAGGAADPVTGAEQVMECFAGFAPHTDVVPGLMALAQRGCRIVTLSNGSAEVARTLLADTGAEEVIEAYLAVADARSWKPARDAYAHALAATLVPAERAMLVAAHPWDIEGAHRAGLGTAWLNRAGAAYPDHHTRAELEVSSLVDLAARLR